MIQEQSPEPIVQAVDTLRIIDTVTVVDTVSTGVPVSIVTTIGVVAWLIGTLFGSGILWKVLERRSTSRVLLIRISTEAWEARRELRAGFENQLTEPPGNRSDQLIDWARHLRKGFDVLKRRFTELTKLAVNAPEEVRKVVLATSVKFDQASGVINRVFGQSLVDINQGTDDQLRPTYGDVRGLITDLGNLIDDEYQDADDGYNQP